MNRIKERTTLNYSRNEHEGRYSDYNRSTNNYARPSMQYDNSSERYDSRADFASDNNYNDRDICDYPSYDQRPLNDVRLKDIDRASERNGYNYSSYNRYYNGNAEIRNDIVAPKDTRKTVQNQNTAYSNANYTRVTQDSNYDRYNTQPRSEKKRMSMRAKICILVICAIAVLAGSLMVANMLPNASAQSNENTQEVAFQEQAGSKVIDENGNTTSVDMVSADSSYNYTASSNWFDKFCDWVEKIVG